MILRDRNRDVCLDEEFYRNHSNKKDFNKLLRYILIFKPIEMMHHLHKSGDVTLTLDVLIEKISPANIDEKLQNI